MVNWKRTLDVSEYWKKAQDREIDAVTLAKYISAALTCLCIEDEELNEIIEEFTLLDGNFDDFDDVWCRLYDWADEGHRLWLKTS